MKPPQYTFEQADEELISSATKRLGANLSLNRLDNDTFGIRYHQTTIVYIYRSGIYQLNTGQWMNKSTKKHLNTYSPANVYQEGDTWYIGDFVYRDGVRVDGNGIVLDDLPRKIS